jgi:hypothetical protein
VRVCCVCDTCVRQVHRNASINGMSAHDLQRALYDTLLPPSKGDYKDVIGTMIVNFDAVFEISREDDDERSTSS